MNQLLEKALARPEVLIMGPVVSPSTGDKFPIHLTTRKLYSFPDSLLAIAQETLKF